jgi:radical SAM protein with 4Fe4S-binding SPASM domain
MNKRLVDLDPRVKFFSPADAPQKRSFGARIRGWAARDKPELMHALVRKVLKVVHGQSMPFAQAVHVEVTNACNLKCTMCPHPQMERPIGRMSTELFQKIISQIAPYRRIIEGVALMGLGEPLLHAGLEEFSKIAKSAGLPNVYTSTNAMLLDEKRAKSLLAKGQFDRVIFSVDGVTAETFHKIRVGADFETVYQNIQMFLDLRGKQTRRPRATLQILVFEETEGELYEYCEYWLKRLGPDDEILIKRVDTFGGLVKDRRLDAKREPTKRFACRQLWKDMSVSWDGRVTVCCKDVFYRLGVGDANTTHLVEFWKSEKWEAIRTAHAKGVFDMEPCDNCREWYL